MFLPSTTNFYPLGDSVILLRLHGLCCQSPLPRVVSHSTNAFMDVQVAYACLVNLHNKIYSHFIDEKIKTHSLNDLYNGTYLVHAREKTQIKYLPVSSFNTTYFKGHY